jgi:enoyl-CoA hydratase/carnithine racemase
MTNYIATEVADNILAIRMNRPDKKNAINIDMYAAMTAAFEGAEANPAVRVITISGSGDSFSSGNDISDFLERPPAGEGSPVTQFIKAISTSTKPLIASVNGLAVGIGVTMLLHCDVVYASDDATFQLPFANLALVPEAASSLLLPRLMGHQRAAEMLLFGDKLDALTAHELGIVNAVYPASELAAVMLGRAAVLAGKPPAAVRLIKALLKSETATVPARLEEEGRHFLQQLKSPEAREALEAFLQRRKPDFSRFS